MHCQLKSKVASCADDGMMNKPKYDLADFSSVFFFWHGPTGGWGWEEQIVALFAILELSKILKSCIFTKFASLRIWESLLFGILYALFLTFLNFFFIRQLFFCKNPHTKHTRMQRKIIVSWNGSVRYRQLTLSMQKSAPLFSLV